MYRRCYIHFILALKSIWASTHWKKQYLFITIHRLLNLVGNILAILMSLFFFLCFAFLGTIFLFLLNLQNKHKRTTQLNIWKKKGKNENYNTWYMKNILYRRHKHNWVWNVCFNCFSCLYETFHIQLCLCPLCWWLHSSCYNSSSRQDICTTHTIFDISWCRQQRL